MMRNCEAERFGKGEKMRFCEKITLTEEETKTVERLLTKEPSCRKNCFGENETFVKTARFPDGIQMDVKICGVEYDPHAETNLPWTEAVLFNERGGEIACSEPSEGYDGEWLLESDGNEYSATVIPFGV